MSMTVEYVQERGKRSKSFRYRRKVPPALKTILGKGEIVIPLGKTKAEALRSYGEVHREAEAVLAAAWDEANGVKRAKPNSLGLVLIGVPSSPCGQLGRLALLLALQRRLTAPVYHEGRAGEPRSFQPVRPFSGISNTQGLP